MMRRCPLWLAAASSIKSPADQYVGIVEAEEEVGDKSSKHGSGDKGASAKKNDNTGATVDPTPTASEAPHILPRYEEKPFVSAKKIKEFIASLFVGFGCIAGVYYLLSNTLAKQYEAETSLLRNLVHDASIKVPPAPELPQFVAPSSFSNLKKRVAEQAKLDAIAAREAALAKLKHPQTPVLHQEFMEALKERWNTRVTDIQKTVEMVSIQIKEYREKQMEVALGALLESRGYTLTSLKQVE